MFGRIFKVLVSLVLYTIDLCSRIVASFFHMQCSETFVILTYHNVRHEKRSVFEEQMRTLIKIGRPVMLGTTVGVSNKYHRIAVTFDDGYQSVFENAIPIMRQRLISATIFVTTGCLGQKPTWVSPDHVYAT